MGYLKSQAWTLRWPVLLLLLLCCAAAPVTITIDPSKPGRTFEGIGAVSAGASSRLLIDYPEPQRSQILDYLFKPNYGASLQHLKVEIGGDVNSTDGVEPSHMHTRSDENYTRGYEWWLMKEAKKRNPNILLDTLAWGAPGWIGNGKFYSQDMADYVVKFIQGAKKVHGLDITLTGIWNERPCDISWIKLLRQTLDRNGLQSVKIVAAEEINKWKIINDLLKDPDPKNAIHAVGVHYPRYKSPPDAQSCGKPLWSSEDGPWTGEWKGQKFSGPLAATYNRNYVLGRMTKTEIWSPITSYYDNLPLPGSGLMRANTPWSGHYQVQPAVWMTAHTTQFAQPGWTYLDSACVMIEQGGSVVALQSPDAKHYSLIIESMELKQPTTLAFKLASGLPTGPLHAWRSNAAEQFVQLPTIQPADGAFSINIEPNSLYSLTTTTGQSKSNAAPPPAKPFPFPYTDDFESYEPGSTPRYSSDQAGVFEVAVRSDGQGKSLRQVIPSKGIEWQKNPFPETILGDSSWRNYSVSIDALIEHSGFVSLFGRVGTIDQNANPPRGYWLSVDFTGTWKLTAFVPPPKKDKNSKPTTQPTPVLATGAVAFPPDTWHNLTLTFENDTIQVIIDGKIQSTVTDATCASGMIGIGSGWNGAQFDNLHIQSKESN